MSIAAVIFAALACLIAIVVPWIGVLFYYLFSVGQLQAMWPHHFGEGRVSLMITAATIIGLGGATAIKLVNYRVLFYPHIILMMILWAWVNLSVDFSSYLIHVERMKGDVPQEEIIVIFNKIMVFYFVAALLIDTRKKLEWLIYTLALIVLFYTYWANAMYLTGQFQYFGINQRLGGPPFSLYQDENNLAMLFVLATPVLYYLGVARKHMIARYAVWMLIPLTWHALFLTGSRGGLLSLGVVCVYIFFRSYYKKASIGISVGLVLAIVLQGGNMLNRVDVTIQEANEADVSKRARVEGETKALDPRLVSWQVGLKIMRDFPGFGVGVGNFTLAFPDYSNTKRHVAHNTFLQFASGCGILAGLIYLWFFATRFLSFFKRLPPDAKFHNGLHRDYLEDLLTSLYVGFFVAALFLDLMLFEILYMVILMGFAKYAIDNKVEKIARKPKKSIYRFGQKDEPKDDDAELKPALATNPARQRTR